jgi:hypothetical protein
MLENYRSLNGNLKSSYGNLHVYDMKKQKSFKNRLNVFDSGGMLEKDRSLTVSDRTKVGPSLELRYLSSRRKVLAGISGRAKTSAERLYATPIVGYIMMADAILVSRLTCTNV